MCCTVTMPCLGNPAQIITLEGIDACFTVHEALAAHHLGTRIELLDQFYLLQPGTVDEGFGTLEGAIR